MAEVDRQAEIVAKILDRHFYIRGGGAYRLMHI